jgi:hypothetical protein
MKPVEKTFAILAVVILSTQTVRHGYRLWIEPRGSVLDKFDEPQGGPIRDAKSLDDLIGRYEPVRKEADRIRTERAAKDKEFIQDNLTEPFKSEQALRQAISEWETSANEIREMRVYWLVGFVFVMAGMLMYRRGARWFGISLLLAGFAEMIYWTCPQVIGWGTREADRLLFNKLVFSAISLAILGVGIVAIGAFQETRRKPGKEDGDR